MAAKWLLLIPFGVFIILTRKIMCEIQAVKCCDKEEQLNPDLKSCEPINETQTLSRNGVNLPLENYSLSMSWLPEQLKLTIGTEDIVLVERQNVCSDAQTVHLKTSTDQHRINWLPNGSLVLRSITALGNFEEHQFEPLDFCIDTFRDENGIQDHAILLCACNQLRCIRKCCPIGQAIVCNANGTCECRSHESEWKPFHADLPLPNSDYPYEIVIDKNVTCNEGFVPLSNMFLGYPPYLLQRFWNKFLEGGNMCGDTIVGKMDTPRIGMIRCMRPPPFLQLLDNLLHIPEASFLGLALITTLIVRRRGVSPYSYVHELALTWHTASLLIRSSLWIVYLRAWWSCDLIPIFVYFFSISASFWLNVLCLNMVCGFWKPLGVQYGRWAVDRRMFLGYSLYAWGASAAMTAFTGFMWYSLEAPSSLLRPTLHETRTCFREEDSDGKIATFAYYYGPLTSLLCVNALLFVSTAVRVRLLRKDTKVLSQVHKGKNASFRNEQSVVIYIKLLWLMGVTEMAVEMVTWASNSHVYYNAVILSCLDVLRAFAIFVFCCCKWTTLRALRDRLCACAALRRRKHSTRSTLETELPSVTENDISSVSRETTCGTESTDNVN